MFIELHDYHDGSPILINADDVVMVTENVIILRNNDVTVQEGYEEIKSILTGGQNEHKEVDG